VFIRVHQRPTLSLFFSSLLVLELRRLFTDRTGPPAMLFFACSETGEIAAAGGAAIRGGTAAQQNHSPTRRVIVLLAPGAQILAIAAGTAGKSPGSISPYAGFPARAAFAATQRVDSEQSPNFLPQTCFMGDPYVPCSALWAGKLHLSQSKCRLHYSINRRNIISLLQPRRHER
jgi:hypothetical protein